MSEGLTMTRADDRTLEACPIGKWFSPDDLPFVIRSPRFRCDRLLARGKLTSKVVGKEIHELRTVFRRDVL